MLAAGLREPTFEPDGFFRAVFHRSPELAMKEDVHGSGRKESEFGIEPKVKTRVKTRVKTGVNVGEIIVERMRANPETTVAELAAALGLTKKGVEWHVRQLKAKGRILRVGPARGGRWRVVR